MMSRASFTCYQDLAGGLGAWTPGAKARKGVSAIMKLSSEGRAAITYLTTLITLLTIVSAVGFCHRRQSSVQAA
jgi:hypothetical protein